LIPKSTDVLFEDNEWIRTVVDKLNQGDLALVELFKKHLKKALIQKEALNSDIKIIEMKQDSPYPWLEILVESILKERQKNSSSSLANEFVITVEKKENVNAQIHLLG